MNVASSDENEKRSVDTNSKVLEKIIVTLSVQPSIPELSRTHYFLNILELQIFSVFRNSPEHVIS
jgi:hypothetical protein